MGCEGKQELDVTSGFSVRSLAASNVLIIPLVSLHGYLTPYNQEKRFKILRE